MIFIGLMPYGLRLRLNAADGAKERYAAVKHPQRPLHLNGEINMAGRVDQMKLVARSRQSRLRQR